MDQILNGWKRAQGLGRRVGPYLLLEALMPGGTLLAIGLYLYRHRKECTQ
jgi:hypothetical protein